MVLRGEMFYIYLICMYVEKEEKKKRDGERQKRIFI